MLRSRYPHCRWLLTTLLLSLVATGEALAAQDDPLNRVADGSFENGFVSLSLPAVDWFPVIASGWAARGALTPQVVDHEDSAFDGTHALRLLSQRGSPVHVLQDLALSTTAYELELAFFPEIGTQVVRLFSAWSREQPTAGDLAVAVFLSPEGLEAVTPAGRWSVARPINEGQWHRLRVVSDPRARVQTISLDGSVILSLPGLPQSPPRTLLIGGTDPDEASSFLWDSVRLFQLAETELRALRELAGATLEPETLGWLLPRLDTAATAMFRGAPALALPELRATRRLLGYTGRREPPGTDEAEPADAMSRFQAGLAELSRLLAASIPG